MTFTLEQTRYLYRVKEVMMGTNTLFVWYDDGVKGEHQINRAELVKIIQEFIDEDDYNFHDRKFLNQLKGYYLKYKI